MKLSEKQKYLKNVKDFHKKLEEIIKNFYGIEVEYIEPFAWGYVSTGFYIKCKKGNEYVGLLSENTKEKQRLIKKNITIAKNLSISVKTRDTLKNKDGEYLTFLDKVRYEDSLFIEDKIWTLHHHLKGMLPFDMTRNIFKQEIQLLNEFHNQNYKEFPIKLEEMPTQNPRFLHGDLTPSNVLVSYGKINGVMDFDLSKLGPPEYDIARTTVFSWFRTKDEKVAAMLEIAKEVYPEKLDDPLLKKYCVEHAKNHLANIEKHKEQHENKAELKKELEFAKKSLKIIEKELQ